MSHEELLIYPLLIMAFLLSFVSPDVKKNNSHTKQNVTGRVL